MSSNSLIKKFNLNMTPRENIKPSNMNNILNNTNTSNTGNLFITCQTQNTGALKSYSFCGNGPGVVGNKLPTTIKYNMTDPKQKVLPTSSNNLFLSDPKFTANNKNEEVSNKISIEDIIIGKDKRTTVMMRNIPNKYSLQNLVDEISLTFVGKYDYINLPIDYERKLNLGYAFINFVDPLHVVLFYETYYNKKWSKYRSDKKIDINWAEKQGKKDITCKDENTYFACDDKKLNFKKLCLKLEMPMVLFY